MKIKDILTINLTEDIKNVIDLEDISEAEIQMEIQNYIITEGLAREYSHLAAVFTSNITETGIWLSGFYGSGKSYFGKLWGYMLSNVDILGTPSRDRILQRFSGIENEALIRNSLMKLNNEDYKVVAFDIAKQDTSKGLAFTFFRNFLRVLELPENEHGFMLFQLMINENENNIHKFIREKLNREWKDIKTKLLQYSKATKLIYLQSGNNQNDYDNLMITVRRDIDQFSAARLREELGNYFKIIKDIKVVFLFDEASEALNQKKFTLLDLEGISEGLSALGGKVWTVAIAQEKLDDVISNSNVSKAQLTKVTDRFKTKIHLESTEVDVIIRNRLLNKNEEGIDNLKKNYIKNSGSISDLAMLNGAGLSKTDSMDSYVTYYPFYKYQFELMQNFLFGTKGYASTKVAARGMIISTYDILKKELQKMETYKTATGWQIAKQAQPQPPVRLVNRYDNADRILKENRSNISGRNLLETINFLSEAEIVPTTLSNIVKAFINAPESYYKKEEEIVKALNDLVVAKLLLNVNNTYRITSDVEQRLLDEMNDFTIAPYIRKSMVINIYKSSPIIKSFARISDQNIHYDFYVTSDNDDELTNPSLKYLKLKVKSIYNISDNRALDIEKIKTETQDDKDIIWLVPENNSFSEIDKLLDDVKRISLLEDKYQDPNSVEIQFIRNFSVIKLEKENYVKDLIEKSLQNASLIYLFNTSKLDKENWQSIIQKQQREVIRNVYFKRLLTQIGDQIAGKVIKEAVASKLYTYYNGADFNFFDKQGNLVGEKLKVSEEILGRIKNTFVDGEILEKKLETPPTGFSFGTVISSVAALMRGGKIIAKYNGNEKYSWKDEGVSNIFSNAREFRKTSFKAISKSLTAQQKNEIVDSLQNFNCQENIGRKVDWNTNDFDLVTAVKDLAKRFGDKVDDMTNQNKDFQLLYSEIKNHKEVLLGHTSMINESNYIDKAQYFLNYKDLYENAILKIEKIEKFIRNNQPKVMLWNSFVKGTIDELKKSAKTNEIINIKSEEFNSLFKDNIVKNYLTLQQIAQNIKDEYYRLMLKMSKDMSEKYTLIKNTAHELIEEISKLPEGLNDSSLTKLNNALKYSEQRIVMKIEIDYDIKEKNSRFTYSEMLSSIEIYNTKAMDLEIIKNSLIREIPKYEEVKNTEYDTPNEEPQTIILTHSIQLPNKEMKVIDYKNWLYKELNRIDGLNNIDLIIIKE